ncbi:MAG: FAD:protein FMN transferase [Bacteroidaceae bacterium]|nr:FAD:protein FMN transferase [Bacteroidaceae bacterium]
MTEEKNISSQEDSTKSTNGKADVVASQFRPWHIAALALFIIGTIFIIRRNNTPIPFQKEEGAAFGTFYHIVYQNKESLQPEIQAVLAEVDCSLSMFNQQSIISQINRNEDVVTDSMFRRVFALSQEVSKVTNGAFDITVAPLVNAWGFGFKHGTLPDSIAIDSIRKFIGWQHISLDAEGRLHKEDPRMVLDCSAVAKGFGVDVVADMLRSHGVSNFMVEIGGEIVVNGQNPQGEKWKVGVNSPEDDSLSTSRKLQTILPLTDCAMATSGNYRNYYEAGGRRLSHTIDPHSGYPVQHSLLSATVFAPTCAEADAFATSFMVLGLDSAKQILSSRPSLRAYLIYADEKGDYQVFASPDF